MRRHVLIGRFGTADDVRVPKAKDEVETNLNLLASGRQLAHGLGAAIDHLNSLSIYPTELGFDVAVAAALVHLADTRISRATESQDNWTREMRLVVPVSDPVLWSGVTQTLEQMLNFLTGDRWTVGFRARPRGHRRILKRRGRDRPPATHDALCLFSGGLDSLIGAIDLLKAGRKTLLISHAGDGATSRAQHACFDALKSRFADRQLDRLRVWMTFPKNAVKGVGSEDSTRGRSFLFIALGVLAGSGGGAAFELSVPENGLIALNIPMDVLRLGALSTHTTHPYYLQSWNDLLTGLGIPGRVANPYWNKTKGEMAAGCAAPAVLKRVARTSLSCSSPTKGRWNGRGIEHCGYCFPCVIRRAALQRAWGGRGDRTSYSVTDLRLHPLNTLKAEGAQVRSIQYAIERLKREPGIERLLVHKAGPLLDEVGNVEQLAAVYKRGMEELNAFLAGVKTKPKS